MAKYNILAMTNNAWRHAADFWLKADKVFGDKIGAMPKIEMNPRLTATAGRAWLEQNKVDLSCYLMDKYQMEFCEDTIPHELCHHIAFRLYNDKGHGAGWKYVMVQMGLVANRCHNMETLSQAKRRT